MSLLYFLSASLCSACDGCPGQFLCLYVFRLSLLTSLRRRVSSFDHQRFDFMQISVVGTSYSMVSCIACVSLSHTRLSVSGELMQDGDSILSSFFSSVFLKLFQSTSRKFLACCVGDLVSSISSTVV